MPRPDGNVTLDLRDLRPELRRPVVFTLVDRLVSLGWDGQMLIVCEHEPAGISYQLDLRKETRGLFEYSYDRRSDGAWVMFIRPKHRPWGDR